MRYQYIKAFADRFTDLIANWVMLLLVTEAFTQSHVVFVVIVVFVVAWLLLCLVFDAACMGVWLERRRIKR